jgi:hypothetical protein
MAQIGNYFLGENPFAEDDSRFSYWLKVNRYAEEEFERLKADILSQYSSKPEDEPNKYCYLVADLVSGQFDIRIKYLARLFVGNYEAVQLWEQAAILLMNSHISLIQNARLSFIARSDLESETKMRLLQRLSLRKAEALKLARVAEQKKASSETWKQLQADPDYQRRIREGQTAIDRAKEAVNRSQQARLSNSREHGDKEEAEKYREMLKNLLRAVGEEKNLKDLKKDLDSSIQCFDESLSQPEKIDRSFLDEKRREFTALQQPIQQLSGHVPASAVPKKTKRNGDPKSETPQPLKRQKANIVKRRDAKKGDATLLLDKHSVHFKTAEAYLGINERQRQILIKRGSLEVEGRGQNRKITTESLKKYNPPENPH